MAASSVVDAVAGLTADSAMTAASLFADAAVATLDAGLSALSVSLATLASLVAVNGAVALGIGAPIAVFGVLATVISVVLRFLVARVQKVVARSATTNAGALPDREFDDTARELQASIPSTTDAAKRVSTTPYGKRSVVVPFSKMAAAEWNSLQRPEGWTLQSFAAEAFDELESTAEVGSAALAQRLLLNGRPTADNALLEPGDMVELLPEQQSSSR